MTAVPRPTSSRQQTKVPSDEATIAGLRAELEAQAQLIREQATALAHSRKIFDRASATARIGVWECDLADEALTWTDQVYDLFDIPRGAPLDRQHLLTFYTPQSLREMSEARSRAIAERSGFALDAEIITAKGRRRWMRLTATVECENGIPVRIFGMKQDITEEKLLSDRLRYLAEYDVMTGLANRSMFQARLDALNANASTPFSALLLVDLDGFKQINDLFGHALGDECLKQTAARLRAICGETHFVARIGGDEFAVLTDARLSPSGLEGAAARIVTGINQPIWCADRSFQIGASVGVARIGADSVTELFAQADAALYAAKAAGRNTYRLFHHGMMEAVMAPPPGMTQPLERRRFRGQRP